MPTRKTDNEVLEECINAVGGSKVVAALLWPDKSVTTQSRYLANCLNPQRPEKLCWEQAVRILRFANENSYHKAMAHFCAKAGYETPRPVNREEVQAELQRRFIKAAKEIKDISKQLEMLGVSDV